MLILASTAHSAPVAPRAMNGTAENSCSKFNLEKRISSYSHSTISECFGWAGVDSAQFSMRWRSLNKDAVKISYGWCPATCSTYRSSSCTWGSERNEKGTNFEQSLSATVNNRHYKNPVSCVQVKCDNWHETCQLEISSVSVSGNSMEDDFVDKSLPPSLVATTPKLMEPERASEKNGSVSLSDDISAAAGSRRLSENPPAGGSGLCLGGPNCLCAGGQVANVCLLVWVVLGLIVAVILVPICCFCGLCMSCGFAAGGCCKQQTQAVHVYGNQPSNGAQYLLPHQQKVLSGGE